MYCGIPFIGINMAAPFLMLGIGIDDTFVMLGAWRRTSIHAPVEERMADTFRDAAVSVTITSVTDMLSFFVGVITPFPCVRIFCIYTGKNLVRKKDSFFPCETHEENADDEENDNDVKEAISNRISFL